ncbi:MAG: N-acyl homoserine lactonase family protein [Pseudomonadota bacterium]
MRLRTLLGIALLVAAPSLPANIELYVIDCGWIGLADVSAFGLTNSETDVRELFVPCYLIEHPEGLMLWDGGLPLAMAGRPRQEMQPGMEVEYKVSLIEQLAGIGVKPQDIDQVAFSHFHFDHVGAANAFAFSTLLIQQTEYDAAFAAEVTNPVFERSLYEGLSKSEKVLLNGDHDVFGDGRVRIISAPGHTPGHQVLLLNLDKTGKVLLSGDLYHFEFNRTARRTPVFNTNAEQTLASMTRVEELLKAEGAKLWIEHSLALAQSQKKIPAYYE